jgi:oligoribonuclease (3'-5' exoribonuclease)
VKFEKKNAHRALGDIRESIAELKHYLSFVKVPAPNGGVAKENE